MKNVTTGFGASAAADGLRAFAAYYEARPFVGRTNELAVLDDWLAGDAQTMLVVAPAGRGKSALLWRWVQDKPAVVWVPISVRFDTARSETVRALLSTKLQAMGAAPGGDWTDLAQRQSPVVVVLDGIDECADEGLVDDLRDLPDGVRVVVAARELVDRDAAEWATTLGWRGEILELGGLDRAGVTELVGDVDAHVLNEIVGRADGDPLTASLLADAARAGRNFEAWWTAESVDHELLAALARAVAPAPVSLLAGVLGVPTDEVRASLQTARRFLVTNANGGVSFAHPRLGYTFEERLGADDVTRLDAQWRATVEDFANDLRSATRAERTYVLQSRMTHEARCGTRATTLAATVSRQWLADWEDHEGGTTGFLGDVDVAWAALERELDDAWSDELCIEQMRLCAIRAGLSSIERAVTPRTRAAAVRLGIRSQRAAIASVGEIADAFRRNEAIKALLPELDDHGFDLLLHALEVVRGEALPVREIAEHLLDAGLAEEAAQWILEDKRSRRGAIVHLIDRFTDPEPFRAAVREDLESIADDDPEWRAECRIESAAVFDDGERRALLREAGEIIDDIGDENLWWDSYYDESDVRLLLADAWIDLGQRDEAQRWLDRVWANPIPHSEGANGITPHAVAVWAKFGEVPDELLDRAYEQEAASWILFEAGLVTRETARQAIGTMDGPKLVRVFERDDEEMCKLAAERAVEMLDAHIAEPDEYGPAYGLYMLGARALGLGAPFLAPSERRLVLERAWEALRQTRGPISLYNTYEAVLGLLAATDSTSRSRVAAEVLEFATSREITLGSPALCDFASWWDAFDEGHREYVVRALSQKRLGRPDDWVKLLVGLGDVEAARVALTLARRAGTDEGVAAVSQIPELWNEVAEAGITRFEADEFGVWALSRIIAHAPTPEQAERLASRAWAARFADIASMGCSGDMLRALPIEKAEEIADELIDRDLMTFVDGRHIPPKARARFIEVTFGTAESLLERAQAYLNLVDVGIPDAERLERLRTEVLDEAIANVDDEEAIDALEALVRHLDHERAAAVAEVLFEHGNEYGHVHLGTRLRELGLDALIPDDAPRAQLNELGVALRAAENLNDVIEVLATEPKARTYTWVSNIIVERGLTESWARHVATFDEPGTRLYVWNMIWSELNEALRDELMPLVHEAITESQKSSHGARKNWMGRLTIDEVRRHWRGEMRARRQDAVPSVPSAYSAPLGLAREHALVLADVVGWFAE